jgi:lysophospholipase L1-like esterase
MQNPEFLFLGNSIMEGYQLEKHFNKPYLNRGIGGDTAEGILLRLYEVIDKIPANIVFMIGINDISLGIDEDVILENYKAILDDIGDNLPHCKIYTLSVLPVIDTYSPERFGLNAAYWLSGINPYEINDKIVWLNKKIMKIAEKTGTQFIDLHSCFLDQENKKDLNPELTYDNVHLNEKGYQLMTKLLREKIEDI